MTPPLFPASLLSRGRLALQHFGGKARLRRKIFAGFFLASQKKVSEHVVVVIIAAKVTVVVVVVEINVDDRLGW